MRRKDSGRKDRRGQGERRKIRGDKKTWVLKCSSDGCSSSFLQAEQEIKMQGWKHVCMSLCVRLSIIAVK